MESIKNFPSKAVPPKLDSFFKPKTYRGEFEQDFKSTFPVENATLASRH